MSFLSILHKVVGVVGQVEHVAAPIAETLFPTVAGPIQSVDGIFQKLVGSVVTAEGAITQPSTGISKATVVVNDFEAGLQFTQDVLALEGKTLTYDTAALQTAINAQVTAFNAMAAVKSSFKITALPTPPAATP